MRRFWRGLMIFVLGGLLGTGLGVALGFFLFPFVFPPPPATEQVQASDGLVVASGQFIHVNPSDPLHWGEGKVSIYENAVFLEPDFQVGAGPRYHLYLVPRAQVRDEAHVNGTRLVDLGQLRSFRGSQRFSVPDGVTIKDYPSVVVWCVQFNVLISAADLTFQ